MARKRSGQRSRPPRPQRGNPAGGSKGANKWPTGGSYF